MSRATRCRTTTSRGNSAGKEGVTMSDQVRGNNSTHFQIGRGVGPRSIREHQYFTLPPLVRSDSVGLPPNSPDSHRTPTELTGLPPDSGGLRWTLVDSGESGQSSVESTGVRWESGGSPVDFWCQTLTLTNLMLDSSGLRSEFCGFLGLSSDCDCDCD